MLMENVYVFARFFRWGSYISGVVVSVPKVRDCAGCLEYALYEVCCELSCYDKEESKKQRGQKVVIGGYHYRTNFFKGVLPSNNEIWLCKIVKILPKKQFVLVHLVKKIEPKGPIIYDEEEYLRPIRIYCEKKSVNIDISKMYDIINFTKILHKNFSSRWCNQLVEIFCNSSSTGVSKFDSVGNILRNYDIDMPSVFMKYRYNDEEFEKIVLVTIYCLKKINIGFKSNFFANIFKKISVKNERSLILQNDYFNDLEALKNQCCIIS